jgi:hypothetical protein
MGSYKRNIKTKAPILSSFGTDSKEEKIVEKINIKKIKTSISTNTALILSIKSG